MKIVWPAILLVIFGFSSCDSCYNVACDVPNVEYINGLHFAFDSQSFPFEQVDNAIILRFHPGNLDVPLDTIFLKDVISDEERDFHFPPITDASGNGVFTYGIYDNSQEHAFIISAISVKGYYPTDCCCCYRNTEKTFVMNGSEIDRTGVTDVVLLRK